MDKNMIFGPQYRCFCDLRHIQCYLHCGKRNFPLKLKSFPTSHFLSTHQRHDRRMLCITKIITMAEGGLSPESRDWLPRTAAFIGSAPWRNGCPFFGRVMSHVVFSMTSLPMLLVSQHHDPETCGYNLNKVGLGYLGSTNMEKKAKESWRGRCACVCVCMRTPG